MPTRQAIEERMIRILNRDDLAVEVPDWLRVAHFNAQVTHDFQCMESSAFTGMGVGQTRFEMPLDFKNPILLYVYDPFREAMLRRFFTADIEEVRGERVNPVTVYRSIYAIWNNIFEVDPGISESETLYQLRLDYHAYLPMPEPDESDWLLEHGETYLIYAGLAESAPFLGADTRLEMWEARALKAWSILYRSDISAKSTGRMQLRG